MGLQGGAAASLFGRDVETARVGEVVDAARGGRSRTLLVVGTAGVGKTSLVRRVVDAAAGEGVLALWGAGLPMATLGSPFRTVRGMLRDLPEGLPSPPVGPGGGAGSVGVDPVALDAWLDLVARERPVVIVADDLQWVDQESLDVLRYVAAGTRERAIAVVLTLRSEEVGVGHPLHRWLGHVRRLPGFEELDLAPLDRYATGELVTAVLGRRPHESLVDDVFRRSDGVPYLTRLLVSGLDREARTLPVEAASGLEDAVLAAWHELSPDARELTTVLAIGGQALGRSEVAALVDGRLDVNRVPPSLAEAVDHAVLDVDTQGRYWFHHPLQAELLEANAHPEDRREWHERVALLLQSAVEAEHGPDDAARVVAAADHYAAAGMDAEAYAWSLRVADSVGGCASDRDTVRALRRALDLREAAGASEPPEVELLVRLRSATARAGDLWGELDAVERLLEVTDREEHPEVAAELIVRRNRLRFTCLQRALRIADVEEAVALSSRRPHSWQHALALGQLAQACFEARDGDGRDRDRARDLSAQAVQIAATAGNHAALANALGIRVVLLVFEGHREAAQALSRRAYEEGALSGDYATFTYGVAAEGNAEGCIHRPERRDRLLRARTRLIEMGGPHSWVAVLSQNAARAAVNIGDLSTTRAMVRDALGADPGPLADVGTRLAATRLATLTGRRDEAALHWARVEELAQDRFPHLGNDTIHIELLLASDEAQHAYDLSVRLLREGADYIHMGEWLLPLAARALADLGAAESEVDRLQSEFPPSTPDGAVPSPIPLDGFPDETRYKAQRAAFEDWYRAELARGRRSSGAPALWDTAAAALDAVGLPWEAAYAWMRWGESLLRADRVDRRAAARALRGAVERATPLEAAPVLDQAQALAREARIDLSTPKNTATGTRWSNLTPRESEILGHLEAGRTYAEIADDLFLSEKTVSSHISKMLRKTGTTNRHDLVARAREARKHSR